MAYLSGGIGSLLSIYIYRLFFGIDIDECQMDLDNCAEVCVNTYGTYHCACNIGYTLNADGITCRGTYTILHIAAGNLFMGNLLYRY